MARGAVPEAELENYYVEDKYDEFSRACEEGSAVGCHSLGQWFAVVAEKPAEAYRVFKRNCLERRSGNSCLSAGLMHFKAGRPDEAPEAEAAVGLVKSDPVAVAFFLKACECDPPHEQVRHFLGKPIGVVASARHRCRAVSFSGDDASGGCWWW
jgi:hypothetical protein